jgi:hypothetical protein
MKHGFVTKMEDILDADKKTTHEKLATEVRMLVQNSSQRLICVNQ